MTINASIIARSCASATNIRFSKPSHAYVFCGLYNYMGTDEWGDLAADIDYQTGYQKGSPFAKSPPLTNRGGIDNNQQLTPNPPIDHLHPFYTSEVVPVYHEPEINVQIDYFTVTIPMSTIRHYVISKYDPGSRVRLRPIVDDITAAVDAYDIDNDDDGKTVIGLTYSELVGQFPIYSSPLSKQDDILVGFFLDDLSKIIPDMEYRQSTGGTFGYRKSGFITRVFAQAGKYAYDGNNDTLMISLSGQGCSLVDMVKLHDFYKPLSPKVTRVDIPYDDLEGIISFSEWVQLAHDGAFNSGAGCPPNIQLITNSDKTKGDTLYIGKLKNGKENCIYEKGKQLGDPTSTWVRSEGKVRAVDRVIPLDVLLNPGAYLLGMNPVLRDRLKAKGAIKIAIVKKVVKITLDSLIESCSVGYGKLVGTLRNIGHTDKEIVDKLARDGMPRRLNSLALGGA